MTSEPNRDKTEPLISEYSKIGRSAYSLPDLDVKEQLLSKIIPKEYLSSDDIDLPEISEVDLIRHFTNLSNKNFGVDTGFYPLGSCTMKYNPKVNEDISRYDGFTNIHPFQYDKEVQGILELLYNFEEYLCSLFGYDAFTFQPAAGAHGELTALFMIKAYLKDKGQGKRDKVIVPDSAHGTNPASVNMLGWKAVQVRTNEKGVIDLDELKKVVGADTAALMLTNPNTLGLFDENICEVSKIVHDAGGLLYYDGANANATLGHVRPADMGFDVAHFNLHKTFATPHGGGGPGSGPVGVNKKLEPYLPIPRVVKEKSGYRLRVTGYDKSIGRVHSFNGNINVIIKAYSYLLAIGNKGLKDVADNAVLNANYVMNKLKDYYYLPYDRICQHEFVISAKWQKDKYNVLALDIAKRLIDYGYHPPTIYFPLIVGEAMMIEPTETESKETLDKFCDAMIAIAKECETDPDIVRNAPTTAPVSRLDETKAARDPKLTWKE